MPILKLVDSNAEMLPDANLRILAVMAHPRDRQARNEMLRSVRAELRPRTRGRRPKPAEPIFRQFRDAVPDGQVAGDILLRLIEIEDEGGSPSLTEAYLRMSDHVASVLLKDKELQDQPENFRPRGRMNKRAALGAWHSYRSVAHLWAAHIHSHGDGSSEFDIADFRNVRPFIDLSTYYALRGYKIRLKTRPPQRALDRSTAWRFRLPISWKVNSSGSVSVSSCQ